MSIHDQSLPPDENRGPNLIAFWWVTLSIPTIVVALRVYVRVIIRKTSGWDDWLICLALVIQVLGTSLATVTVYGGYGRHLSRLNEHEVQNFIKWITATEIVSIPSSVLAKVSICIFVLRIVPNPQRAFVVAVWIFIMFLAATCITTMMVLGLQCIPLSKLWNPAISGECLPVWVVKWVFQGYRITGCLTDFACALIFPVLILRTLQTDRATRSAVLLLLGLAVFPGICCILKTYYAGVIVDPDYAWRGYNEGIWISLETNTGIIIACLPILYPWIARSYKTILRTLTPANIGASKAVYYLSANLTQGRKTEVLPAHYGQSPQAQTKTTTTITTRSKRESWFGITKLFHSPDTRASESSTDASRTTPPSPPPKLPPAPPPAPPDYIASPRLSGTAARSPGLSRNDSQRSRLSDETIRPSRQSPEVRGTSQVFDRATPAGRVSTEVRGSARDPGCIPAGRLSREDSATRRTSGRVTPTDRPSRVNSRSQQASGRVSRQNSRAADVSGRVTPITRSEEAAPMAMIPGQDALPPTQQPIQTSLMAHEDLSVFPSRADPDFEERVLRRMQALMSPGPSRSQTPALPPL